MQALLLLPESPESLALLGREVAGTPLLARIIATAARSGVTSVLVLHRKVDGEGCPTSLHHRALGSIQVSTFALDSRFDPADASAWRQLEGRLESRFLWLPWNFIAHRPSLRTLLEAAADQSAGVPAAACPRFLAAPGVEGWPVRSPADIPSVERALVRFSGKEADGIYSRFNRRLVRPFVRLLAHTPVTPNMVSFSGLPLAFLSGYFFAQGYWLAYVVASLLYFASVLVDEIDGMLARLTFRESPFGCWLETFVDYVSYLPVFAGMTIGLSRQYGSHWLWTGSLVLFGTVLTCLVLIGQRKLATSPDKPAEYAARYNRLLESDSRNIVSRLVRTLHFFLKKGVLCHYVVIFSVLGGLPVFFFLAAFGSNVAWMVSLYNNRLFKRPGCACVTSANIPATPELR